MNLDDKLSLREEIQVRLDTSGTIGVWVARTGEYVPIDPEALYLLSLLSLGGSLRAVIDRGGFENDDTFREMLGVFASRRLVTGALPFVPVATTAPDRGTSTVPIFVLGHPRSGTTLVRWILDSHPRICCTADTYVLRTLKQAFWSGRPELQNLRRLGVSDDLLKKLIMQLVTTFYEAIARTSGKPRWADKTNAYTEHADFLSWLFEGQCQFIVVVRHGLDVASSDFFSRSGAWATADAPPDGTNGDGPSTFPLEAQLRGWARTNDYLHRFVTRNAQRCLCVRYEDLVRDPQHWAGRMFGFLGEACPEDLLDRVFAHDHDPTRAGPVFEDYKIRHTSKIETDRVGRWHQWPTELVASIADLANPTLRRWGYDEVQIVPVSPRADVATASVMV